MDARRLHAPPLSHDSAHATPPAASTNGDAAAASADATVAASLAEQLQRLQKEMDDALAAKDAELQQQREGELQEIDPPETAKLQQQLSMTISEIAHLRAEASASAATVQLHLGTIRDLEKKVATSASAPASSVPASPVSLAHSEIVKMLEKKQVTATRILNITTHLLLKLFTERLHVQEGRSD